MSAKKYKRPTLGPEQAAFANTILEQTALAHGAGWFNDQQQSRIRLMVRTEFAQLEDLNLLFSDDMLDLMSYNNEQSLWPDGDRPEPGDTPTLDLDGEIIEGPGEDDGGEGCDSDSGCGSTDNFGPLVVAVP